MIQSDYMKTEKYKLAKQELESIYSDYFGNVITSTVFFKRLKTLFNGKPKKRYFYLLTFTLRDEAMDLINNAEQYIIKQASRKALKFVQFYYVKEFHKSGKPHWHVSCETLKPLKKDRFNYYTKLYGHVDLSRTKAQTMDEALNYISKSSKPTKILL